ncbi:hypothetical protein ACOSQ2_028274 [Xanthoceras sorbifolium]
MKQIVASFASPHHPSPPDEGGTGKAGQSRWLGRRPITTNKISRSLATFYIPDVWLSQNLSPSITSYGVEETITSMKECKCSFHQISPPATSPTATLRPPAASG